MYLKYVILKLYLEYGTSIWQLLRPDSTRTPPKGSRIIALLVLVVCVAPLFPIFVGSRYCLVCNIDVNK